jgi:hypothetical protein
MRFALIVAAGIAGALSSALWYVPGQMDVKTATIGAGISALVAAVVASRIIDRLQGH